MEELEMIHKKKLLSKIRDVMIEDIISTLKVIIERSKFTVIPRVCIHEGNKIELVSFVDGYEGSYPLIETDIKIVKYRNGLVPLLIVKSLISNKDSSEIILPQVSSTDILIEYGKTIFGRDKRFKQYILNETQSERMDLMEIVTDIIESVGDQYYLTGVSRFSKNLI